MEPTDAQLTTATAQSSGPAVISGGTQQTGGGMLSPMALSPGDTRTGSMVTSKEDEEDSSNAASSDCKSPGQRYVKKYKIGFFVLSLSFRKIFSLYFVF